MATKLAGELLSIPVSEIEIGQRLRPVDPVFADAIGRSMKRDGQATPIVVCRLPGKQTWTLVAGAHRVAGAKLHGLADLRAEIISPRADERSQREVSETLWRRGLDPVERAVFIARQVEIIKLRLGIDPAAPGQAASANVRWSRRRPEDVAAEALDASENFSAAYGWSQEVAAALGVCDRTVRRALRLYRSLQPSLIAQLREAHHPAIDNEGELQKLAKLDDEQQARTVGLLLGGVSRVADAIGGTSKESKPDDKRAGS